ncbi:MAG: type II secretion system F family protein [Candidatus Diapherotrites archaeon]
MYERFAFFVPKKIIEEFEKQLKYNGRHDKPKNYVGMLIFYSIVLSIILGFVAFSLKENFFYGIILGLVSPLTISYLTLKLNSESRGKMVENVLPDALQLVASNMKSGMTTERALFVAARPEFGPLQKELVTASKLIAAGETVENALKNMTYSINSQVLEKVVWLISQGVKSGAQMADLLFQMSEDLKNEQTIKDEIAANISIYIIIIIFAAAVGAPTLFGLSTFIAQVMTKQVSETKELSLYEGVTAGNLGTIGSFVAGKRELIDPKFITDFALLMLLVSNFFAALTIGVIKSGKELNGIRYLLPLIISSLIVFFIVRNLLENIFSSLL